MIEYELNNPGWDTLVTGDEFKSMQPRLDKIPLFYAMLDFLFSCNHAVESFLIHRPASRSNLRVK